MLHLPCGNTDSCELQVIVTDKQGWRDHLRATLVNFELDVEAATEAEHRSKRCSKGDPATPPKTTLGLLAFFEQSRIEPNTRISEEYSVVDHPHLHGNHRRY